jgi:hypothetical protein
MIPALLHQLDTMKTATRLPWRQLCAPLAYASVMRWRQRQRQHHPVCQTPGPKKPAPFNAAEFYPLLRALPAGVSRTHGTGELYARFAPLLPEQLDGAQIAAHLERLFRQHGAPLFLKRDNGSPFNHHRVDEVLARFGVLPLNNPPHFPRYNGAMEKGIRDFKAALAQRPSAPLVLAAELTAHELNHRPRRCLNGRTACAVFHDPAHRLRWSRPQRQIIFRLLFRHFGQMIGSMANGNHHPHATAWRLTVESWLRCQGLIAVRQNQPTKVSTTSPKCWSHN